MHFWGFRVPELCSRSERLQCQSMFSRLRWPTNFDQKTFPWRLLSLTLFNLNKTPFCFRKSLMSGIFPPAISGPEMAAPILWAPAIFWNFLLANPHAHKICHFREGVGFLGWGGRGRSANFILWAQGFFRLLQVYLNFSAWPYLQTLIGNESRFMHGFAVNTLRKSQYLTPNMTGRRFHHITEVIPCHPWKSKSPFLGIRKGGGKTYRAILGGENVPQSNPSKTSFGGLRKWDLSGLCPFPLRRMTLRKQRGGGIVS